MGNTYADCDVCDDCGLVDCICGIDDDRDDDDIEGDGPCECDVCADDDDDTPEAAAAEYVRRNNGDLFRQTADLGTTSGKAAPDFARCPDPAATPMQAFARSVLAHATARATQPPDVAWDWVRSVESLDADDVPAPVPVDELSVMIRENGELAETPALALLDEIQRLRTALAARDADYDRGIADAVAVVDEELGHARKRTVGDGWTFPSEAEYAVHDARIGALELARDAVAALKRGES